MDNTPANMALVFNKQDVAELEKRTNQALDNQKNRIKSKPVPTYHQENLLSELVSEEQITEFERYCFRSDFADKSDEGKTFIRLYRKYIGQAQDAAEHRERISRMVTFCAEKDDSVLMTLGKDKFFFQAWLKYAESVSDTGDVLEYMAQKGIGADFASSYEKIAKYFETNQKDLIKAEAHLRQGINHLRSDKAFALELKKLQRVQSEFEKRAKKEADQVRRVIHDCRRNNRQYQLMQGLKERQLETQQLLRRDPAFEPKREYTENQKIIGGVPIYVDP